MIAPHVKLSVTSLRAAERIVGTSSTLKEQVQRFVRSRGKTGATDQEIQAALDMDPSTQRPRRIELVNEGVLVKSNKQRTTASGRQAAVWLAA